MTENVHWPNEDAKDPNGKTQQVTIFAWDYETKRGTAYLPGLHIVQVRTDKTLTIVPEQEKKA